MTDSEPTDVRKLRSGPIRHESLSSELLEHVHIQIYRGDVDTLSESLDHIQKATTRILSALEAPMPRLTVSA